MHDETAAAALLHSLSAHERTKERTDGAPNRWMLCLLVSAELRQSVPFDREIELRTEGV